MSDDKLNAINRELEEKEVIAQAKKTGLPYVNLASFSINIDLLKLIPEEEARSGNLMPFFRVGKKIRLAVLNPEDPATKAVLTKLRQAGYLISVSLTSKSSLYESLETYNSSLVKKDTHIFANEVAEATLSAYEQEIENLSNLRDKLEKSDSAEALNTLLVGSVRSTASDIHLEPYEKEGKIRFRIDGVMQDILSLKKESFEGILTQLKQKSKLKLNITGEPQDGRFFFMINERKVDVRVSSIPTIYGESLVLRLLDSRKQTLGLDDLGLEGRAKTLVTEAMGRPNGVILSTGPTGSGKTTTLYAILSLLKTPEKKIITLEDPVEYHIEGVSQSQIDPEGDYTFAKGLRSILRQDPDIVMVGEIRDLETAEIAAQAALTGHIVLSTLHTSNAINAIPRLINMGLKPYMVGPALDTVIAQRLVRRVCPECGTKEKVKEDLKPLLEKELADIKKITNNEVEFPVTLPKAVGCDFCSHTGYHGQLGLFEVLSLDRNIERMIMEKKAPSEIYDYARANGMLTLREDGVVKVLEGKTTLDEVLRVTGDQ